MSAVLVFHLAFFLLLLTIQITRFRFNLFHPNLIYLLFHGLVFVLRPIEVELFSFNSMFDVMGFHPNDAQANVTLLASDVGLMSFCLLGWAATWGCPAIKFHHDPIFSESSEGVRGRRALRYALWLLLPPALISLAYSVAHPLQTAAVGGGEISGVRQVIDASTGRRIYENSTAYITDLQFFAGTITVIWAYVNRFTFGSVVPFVLYFAVRASGGHGRFSFVLLSIELMLAYLLEKRKIKLPLKVVALIPVVLLLFSSLGTDRDIIRRSLGLVSGEAAASEKQVKRLEDYSVFGPDFANYDYLSYVVSNVPENSGTFSYFSQYADILVHPIPRIIWKGKPAGSWLDPVDLNAFGNFGVFTPSLVGDGWISLGYVGVVMTLGIAGSLCGVLYKRFAMSAGLSTFSSLSFCAFTSLLPQWFRDGGIGIVEFAAFTLMPIFVWKFFSGCLKRGPKGGAILGSQRGVRAYNQRRSQSYYDRV